VHLQRHEVRYRFGEGIAVGPIGEGGTGSNGGDVYRVSGLVEQLVQIVHTAGAVGGEDPGFARPPSAVHQPGSCSERGICHRRLSVARLGVVLDAQPLDVCAERAIQLGVDPEQLRVGNPRAQGATQAAHLVIPVPGLYQRIRHGPAPGGEQRGEPPFERVGFQTRCLGLAEGW
jgi:hypothetical protein